MGRLIWLPTIQPTNHDLLQSPLPPLHFWWMTQQNVTVEYTTKTLSSFSSLGSNLLRQSFSLDLLIREGDRRACRYIAPSSYYNSTQPIKTFPISPDTTIPATTEMAIFLV